MASENTAFAGQEEKLMEMLALSVPPGATLPTTCGSLVISAGLHEVPAVWVSANLVTSILFACPGPALASWNAQTRAFAGPVWLVSVAFTVVGSGTKFALTVCGAPITILVVELAGLATAPVQLENL